MYALFFPTSYFISTDKFYKIWYVTSRIHLRIIPSVTSLISTIAVSTKWIWYEIFVGDNRLNLLLRIKYKINSDDIFFACPHRNILATFSRSIHCLLKLERRDRANHRSLSRSDDRGCSVDDDKTHKDLRLWCPLRRTPAWQLSIFWYIGWSHRHRRTGDR